MQRILKNINKVLGKSEPSYQVKLGRELYKHTPGSGYPRTVVTQENIYLIQDIVIHITIIRQVAVKPVRDVNGGSGCAGPLLEVR